MCSKEDFDKWQAGDLYLNEYHKKDEKQFLTREEAINRLRDNKYYSDFDFDDEDAVNEALREESLHTHESYFDNDYEEFEQMFTTKNGDVVVACGYYGSDS